MPRRTVFTAPSPSRTAATSPTKQHAGAAGSPPGSAAIFGIAVLENPRLADQAKPRSITYDASFWMGEGLMPLMACFRYFNKDNAEVPDHGAFAVMAMVAQPTEEAELCSDARHTDYDLIGDIVWMAYTPEADARKCPVMIINGPAREISGRDDNPATFTITATQFVQQLREANPGRVHTSVEIPDSGRFKNGKKPLPPNEGSNAAVVGHLTSVERSAPTMVAERFYLSMENVAYFPRSHTSLPVHHPSTPDSGSKRKFTFEDPLTTPTNPSKKRASGGCNTYSTLPGSSGSDGGSGGGSACSPGLVA